MQIKFDPKKCEICGGKCCIGESGFIWINPVEIENLSKFLNLNFEKFCEIYTNKIGFKFSLKEKSYQNGFACVFFDEVKKNCKIYDFRPNQCRTFPFWDYYEDKIDELKKECIGVK